MGKIAIIDIASFYKLHEEGPTHSILSPKDVRRICRYLHEVVLHQQLVAEKAVPRNIKATGGGSSALLFLPTLEILHGENLHHHLLPVVLE